MKKLIISIALVEAAITSISAQSYEPTKKNLKAREEFAEDRFGIFIHWGIYSMFAQGEWYLQNAGLNRDEYAKAADAFYPHRFDAKEWVAAIKHRVHAMCASRRATTTASLCGIPMSRIVTV